MLFSDSKNFFLKKVVFLYIFFNKVCLLQFKVIKSLHKTFFFIGARITIPEFCSLFVRHPEKFNQNALADEARNDDYIFLK